MFAPQVFGGKRTQEEGKGMEMKVCGTWSPGLWHLAWVQREWVTGAEKGLKGRKRDGGVQKKKVHTCKNTLGEGKILLSKEKYIRQGPNIDTLIQSPHGPGDTTGTEPRQGPSEFGNANYRRVRLLSYATMKRL